MAAKGNAVEVGASAAAATAAGSPLTAEYMITLYHELGKGGRP